MKKIKITNTSCAYEREPLIKPFGFKGGYMNEIWQTVAGIRCKSGRGTIGIGTQSVLWSDASVFSSHSEAEGNDLMFQITRFALERGRETEWENPVELQDQIFDDVYGYAKKITANPDLRMTFVLNALVAVDNAAWILYAKENGFQDFDAMVPEEYRKSLSFRHEKLACVPLMSYGVSTGDIEIAARDGFFFLKVKIGSDPAGDGDPDKMLDWDMKRIREVHKAVSTIETSHTKNGKIPYYFDANGRYDSKERLLKLLEYAKKMGIFERIAILEKPFPEEYEADVSDLEVRIAADESAHSAQDAEKRIQMGYQAIALKPIAKTLSMSLKIADVCNRRRIPCFCADLTVNPILVDWNKNMAARLPPLPKMDVGVLETNGHQNYKRWDIMKKFHPCFEAGWTQVHDGLFDLDNDFYLRSGGIFEESKHYADLLKE